MIALLHLSAAAMLSGGASQDHGPCSPLDADAILSRVAAVQAASGPNDSTSAQTELTGSRLNDITSALSDLAGEWSRTCVSARERASPPVVSAMAELLRIWPRWTVAVMLLDVRRDNLRYARAAIEQTLREVLAEERRRHRENMEGVIFYDPQAIPRALRCLLGKLRTGVENPHLCEGLLELREADGFR